MYFLPFIIVLFFLFFCKSNILSILAGISIIGIINVWWYNAMTISYFISDIFTNHIYAILHPTGYLYPLVFLLGVGILIDIFQDLSILNSYKFLMQRLFYQKQRWLLSMSVIGSSFLFFLDDYLVMFGIKNFFESLFKDKKNEDGAYQLAMMSSILGACGAALCMSTWSGIILTQIGKMMGHGALAYQEVHLFFMSKKFFFFPIVAYCFLIVKSLIAKKSCDIIEISGSKNQKIILTDIVLFLLFPLSILVVFIYYFRIVGILLVESDIACMLCQGLGLATIIISFLLFILKSVSIKYIIKKGIKTTIGYTKPIISMILCWLFSRLMTDMIIAHSQLFQAILYVPLFLLPLLYYIVSMIIGAILGSEWTTIAMVFPFIRVILHQPESMIAMVIGAVISGSIAGCQLSPVSNTNMTTSAIFELDAVFFYKKKIKYVIIIAILVAAMFIIAPLFY